MKTIIKIILLLMYAYIGKYAFDQWVKMQPIKIKIHK